MLFQNLGNAIYLIKIICLIPGLNIVTLEHLMGIPLLRAESASAGYSCRHLVRKLHQKLVFPSFNLVFVKRFETKRLELKGLSCKAPWSVYSCYLHLFIQH